MNNIKEDKLNKFIEGYKEIRKQAFIIESIDKNYFFDFVDILLKNYEEQKQIREKYKQLYFDKLDKTTDIVIDYDKLLKKVKQLEAKLEFKQWGDLDNLDFEEYMNQFIPKEKIINLKQEIHNVLDRNGITRAYQIAIDEQFEKILKESEGK